MTREKEIFKEAWEYFHDTSSKLDIVKCSPMGNWTDGLVRGFIKGAKWADNNPRMFKGQTEQMEEREIAFMDWWLEEHRGVQPTYADAIAWADKTMVEKACKWLDNWDRHTTFELSMIIGSKFIDKLRKAMEE